MKEREVLERLEHSLCTERLLVDHDDTSRRTIVGELQPATRWGRVSAWPERNQRFLASCGSCAR